jgi:hypothetical protein
MDNDPPASPNALRVDLRFELTLTREGPAPSWHACLAGALPGERLRFESLPELIRYLMRLDLQSPPPRGIR